MTATRTYAMQTCPVCRSEFEPRSNRVVYCSRACMDKANHSRYYRRGETAAIVPSTNYLPRPHQFTDAQFRAELVRIERELTERGLPLVDTTMPACLEKAERIAAAKRRDV